MMPCDQPSPVRLPQHARGESGRQDEVDQLRETLDPIAGSLEAETTGPGLGGATEMALGRRSSSSRGLSEVMAAPVDGCLVRLLLQGVPDRRRNSVQAVDGYLKAKVLPDRHHEVSSIHGTRSGRDDVERGVDPVELPHQLECATSDADRLADALLKLDLQSFGQLVLGRLHVPSGRIAFEQVLLFVIEELGVAAREVLGEVLERFRQYRTWG